MSTPPFIAMPDGVTLLAPPSSPAPVLLAEAATGREPADAANADAPDASDATPRVATGDVLLVPGFTGSKEDYLGILAPLAGFGWRVASMDLPGQNGFAGLGPRGSHTSRSLADVVADVADWFAPDRPVHLVGHSMGGLITRELVLTRADRLASWVPMCSGPASVPAAGHTKLLQLEAALANFPMSAIWAQKEKLDRANGWNPPSQEVADFCARRFIANDPAALSDCAELLMTAPDLTQEVATALTEAKLSGAVVTGELDDEWPPSSQEHMAAELGLPWRVVAGVGHNPATEDPRTTAGLLHEIFTAAHGGDRSQF